MLIGDPLSESTLLEYVAPQASRLSKKELTRILVTGGFYTLREVEDPFELGRLSKHELVVTAVSEKGSWDLLPLFHQARNFDKEAIAALQADGINIGPTGSDDVQLPVADSSKKSAPPRFSIAVLLQETSDAISEFRQRYRGLIWVIGALVGIPLVLVAVIQLVLFLTGKTSVPELIASFAATPTVPALVEPTPTPTTEATESDSSAILPSTVAITEIMFVPQAPFQDRDLESWNEYVELYNYGEQPVDVSGWLISDGGVIGNPDVLVAWDERFPGIPFGEAKVDSTVIPPQGYALVLPRAYAEGNRPYDSQVHEDTTILTIQDDPDSDSELLGKNGLSATGEFLDVLVLFVGSRSEIGEVVSTYGSPHWDETMATSSIRDDQSDRIPFAITSGFGGFRRRFVTGADVTSNWERFIWEDKTPGF